MTLYPLQFEDNFHEAVWGGRGLESRMGKHLPPDARIGESWELSCHPHGEGIVKNGPMRGTKLSEIMKKHPDELVGNALARSNDSFPLLIKFIDATDTLSIQVHPGDEYAARHAGDRGKTEAWHIIHASQTANIICGLSHELTPEITRRAIADGSIAEHLRRFGVKDGDSIYVPAGTVHAIETGVMLYEVQEASDVTYRIYDWGRLGLDGRPRKLAVNEAVDVMNYKDTGEHRTKPAVIRGDGYTRTICAACRYFVVEKYEISMLLDRRMKPTFDSVTILGGTGRIAYSGGALPCSQGQTTLIPACLKEYEIECDTPITALVTYVPESTGHVVDELRRSGISDEQIRGLGGLL